MLKEKNPLIKLKFKEEKDLLFSIQSNIFESFYALYDFILDDPIRIFWFECINILLSYLQLIAFIFDKTVSIYIK